jgi:metal-responsive CopG/Arc/MetJ family transcriptional regulator
MRRYSFFLPDDLRQGLDALHARDGMLASEAIRRALAEFLKARKISIGAKTKGGPRTKRR